MALERAREYLKKFNVEDRISEHSESSATVQLAAQIVGCSEGEIAKSLTFKNREGDPFMVVTAGDARIDNKKFKGEFNYKAKMLTPEEVSELIGHEIGGVCPFGINEGVKVYLDNSLKKYEYVYPACGSENSTIKLSLEELYEISNTESWVDISQEQI